MSQQIQITGGAKVRNLQDVIIGTSGVLSSVAFDVANGVPRLDVNGKILVSQLPNSVMEYKGVWNAATNTPTLVNGTGNQGDVYLCNVAGTVDFGAGPIAFFVGDQVIYSGSIWQRASGATGSVTSVAITESGDSLNITGSPITTSGTINIGFNGTNLQYVNGAGNLTTFPILTGYVPYTGATTDVDLGTFNLTADVITGATGSFASSGGSDTFAINHSSGSGIALNITKGGNGEGLYINKTSGSGNAATIIGTLNATTLVKSGGTSSQFLKADGTVDSTAYGTGSVTSVAALTIGTSGTDLSSTVATSTTTPVITLNVPTASATNRGALSSADWSTFNSKQGTVFATAPISIVSNNISITQASASVDGYLSSTDFNTFNNKISGLGTAGYITRYTGSGGTIGNSGLYDDGTTVSLISRALSGSSASFSSSVTATSFVKTGGTSAQFLKADGSVDSSTYLTTSAAASTYLPLTGGTLSGTLQFTQPVGLLFANAQYIKDNGSGGLFIHSAAAINITSTSLTNNSNTILDSSNYNSYALPLTGGTLTGALNINVSSGTAMNVAGNAIFRGDTGVGTPRQLIITSGGSTPVYLEAKGYGANYQTDFGIRTYNNVGTAFEVFYADSSGRVGINQVNPSYQLDVNGTGRFSDNVLINNSASLSKLSIKGSGSTTGLDLYVFGANATLSNQDNGSLSFETNGTTRLTIASTGNVGIGTASPAQLLHVQKDQTAYTWGKIDNQQNSSSAYAGLMVSTYGNSWGIVMGSSLANSNSLNFVIDAGGSNASKMTITSGGNVGIGTVIPQANLQVTSSSFPVLKVADGIGGGALALGDSTITSNYVGIWRGTANSISGGGFLNIQGNGIAFMSSDNVFGSGSERMRITSDGNLLLGTTDNGSGAKLVFFSTTAAQQIKAAGTAPAITFSNTITSPTIGGVLGAATGANQFVTGTASGDMVLANQFNTGALIFGTSNTERARITSGGDVLIGATSIFNDGKVCISADATRVTIASKVSASTGAEHIRFINPNGVVGYISTSGTVTTYSITSDYRLKQDLKDYKGLELISAIKTYDYEWKADNSRMYGVMAHELAEILPYAVNGTKDEVDKDGNDKMQGVDYSKLVPILVKAIQEQQKQIEELKLKIK